MSRVQRVAAGCSGAGEPGRRFGWHPQAVAQKAEAAPWWEYRVTTFLATDDFATKQLNELAGDGWEYIGLVGTAKPNTNTVPGNEALVASRRARK